MSCSRDNERKYTNDYYILHDVDDNSLVGRMLNLSATGLMMITDEPVKPGKVRKAYMRLPDFIEGTRELMFEIECRWCQYNKRHNWYESGFEFIGLNSISENIIKILLRDWMNTQANSNQNLE